MLGQWGWVTWGTGVGGRAVQLHWGGGRSAPPGGRSGGAVGALGRKVGVGADIRGDRSRGADWRGRISSCGRSVCHPGGEILPGGAKLMVPLADFSEWGGKGVELGCDGYDSSDGGSYNGEGRAFAGCNDLGVMGGEMWDYVEVQL